MKVSNYFKNKGFLLKNKVVLYGLLVLAIFNIFGYLYAKNYDALILFVAVGYLSTFFTKNMVINLGLPIIVTMFVSGRRTIEGMKEGKEGMKDDEEEEKVEGMNDGSDDEEGEEKMSNKKEGMQKGKGKKSGFTNNKLRPASINRNKSDDANDNYIDHSSTLEGAYDNLEKMLGKGGIDGLTNETAALVEQQKKLMQTMDSMQPLLKNANNVLGGIDISKMSGAMDSIVKMMSNLNLTSKK